MSSEIWVVADIKADGQIRKVTFEVLSEARRKLGGSVCAVLLGSGVSDKASELASYGAEKIYVVDNPNLKDFNPDGYVKSLCELIKKHSPAVVLSGNTAFAEDYMPRVASGVGSGLAMDCVDIGMTDDGRLRIKRYSHSSRAISTQEFNGDGSAMIATVRPNSFKEEEAAGAGADCERGCRGYGCRHKNQSA